MTGEPLPTLDMNDLYRALGIPIKSDGSSGPNLSQGADIIFDSQGQAYIWNGSDYVREPRFDDPTKSSTYVAPPRPPTHSTSSSYNVSQSYQDPAALALEARGLDQRAYEFDQEIALKREDSAFAKEQWLFQKQNAIEQLNLQKEELATTQAANARSFYLEQQKLTFMQDQFAFESSLALRQEARATEAQIFSQQTAVAGIQLEMAAITQQANNLQAQLNQEVALFNAGKAADVSMFNIDQQTRVAQFNAEMAFNVEQANVQNERLRQQQLIDVASRISEAAQDPGDRGALASLILANSGFGAPDAALAGADLRTGDSLVPLEAMLRQREDILASDPNPFSFTPITAGQATFTPAAPVSVPKPDFSGVQVPQVNTTPFDPSSIPTQSSAKSTGGGGFDAANQNFIATGQTTAGNEQFISGATGQPLTAEERAMMPDFVIQDLIAKGYIPAAAEGGTMPGMYLGDEKGAELHVPGFDQMGQRIQQVIPADITQRLMQRMGNGGASIQPVPNTPFQMPQFGQMPQRPNIDMRVLMAQLPPELVAMMQRFQGMPAQQQQSLNYLAEPQYGGRPETRAGEPAPRRGQMGGQQAQASAIKNAGAGQSNNPADQPPFNVRSNPADHHQWSQALPGMEGGGIVSGAYIGNPDGDAVHIPIPGTDMTIIMPSKGKNKGMKKMAEGGLYQEQGKSMYEGLLSDTDRSRATAFLDEASRRAAMGTPFDINRLPTPVFASSPGTSPYVANLLASLNAIRRGIPQGYFMEQANQLRPTAYAEGVIGRTR